MKKNARDRYFGHTIEEDLVLLPEELERDAIGLWHLVAAGRDNFELSGSDLVEYVRRHILNLLEKGAKPVFGVRDGVHYWRVVDYGNNPDKIAGAIINEWLTSGVDPKPGDVWFALPHVYEATMPQSTDAETGRRK